MSCEDRKFPVSVADPTLPDCPLVYVNGAFETATGYSIADCVGRNCRFLQGDRTDQPEVSELAEAVGNKVSVATCLLNYRRDGTPFQNLVFINPIRVPDDEPFLIGFQNEYTGSHPKIMAQHGKPGFVSHATSLTDAEERAIKLVHEAVHMRVESIMMLIDAVAQTPD